MTWPASFRLRWGRRRAYVALVALLLLIAGARAEAASAAAQPFVALEKPLRTHSLGTDRWDVWRCAVPPRTKVDEWKDERSRRIAFSAAAAARRIRATAVPYYRELSGNRYRPSFRGRGTIHLGGRETPDDCRDRAAARSAGRDGVVLVIDVAGLRTAFAASDKCIENTERRQPCEGRPRRLPGSRRHAVLSSSLVFGDAKIKPQRATIVHELGHALGWPHSFTGRLFVDYDGTQAGVEYDDAVDVMGYERLWGTGSWTDPSAGVNVPKGTQVFNRLAAGWIPGRAVRVHDDGQAATYELVPGGADGIQLVTLPGTTRATMLTIEARVRAGVDARLPYSGVSLHVVDQDAEICRGLTDAPTVGCWGEDRRQTPAPTDPDSLTASFLRPGDTRSFGEVDVTVAAETATGFRVHVSAGEPTLPYVVPAYCLLSPDVCPDQPPERKKPAH